MSCSPYDLKEYFLGETSQAERSRVEEHVKACAACREELDRLRLTEAALRTLGDEEPPRRTAFVSDAVFEPRWWQWFWQSGPRLGFASAAMLSIAILAHGILRPAATVSPAAVDTAAIEARIGDEVEKRLAPAIAAAVAASEERQARKTLEIVHETEKRIDMDRRGDRVAVEEAFNMLQKKLNLALYPARAELGGQP